MRAAELHDMLYDLKTNNTMRELNIYSLNEITVIMDASGQDIKKEQ
jgi:UDP-N-acetyl-D-mannosaminuronate dehydrogenase